MLTGLKVSEFNEKLASSEPVPGGGGAAALAASAGAALCSMAANLTSGKKKYAAVQDRIEYISECAADLRRELEAMVDRDAEVFLPLSQAYGLPSETEEQKLEKEKTMENALRLAASVPYDIILTVQRVLELHVEAVNICSSLVVSDVGAGCAMLRAAADSAALNIYINTKLMKDRTYAEDLNGRTRDILTMCRDTADRVYAEVEDLLK